MVARHLLGSLSDALPLEARLLVDLADLHEDHRRREEIQFLVDQEARQVLQEQCLVVGSIEQADGLPAHVSLLLDQLLEAELHREVPVVLRVDDEHWLNENDGVRIIDVVFGASLLLLSIFSRSRRLVCLRRTSVHVDAHFDWTVIISRVVELEVDFDEFLALLRRLHRLSSSESVAWTPKLIIVVLLLCTCSTIAQGLQLLVEQLIRVIVLGAILSIDVQVVDANRLSVLC